MIKKTAWMCGLTACLSIAAFAALPAFAAKPVAIEKELLGIRVLQNYREVLVRYGAPTQIFRATETINYQEAVNLAGVGTGGILGIAGSSSGPGGMAGGTMGGYPGMGASGGGRGPGSDYPMMGGGKMGGSGGPMAGPGGPGGPGGGQGDNPEATFGEAGGFTWVYLYPGKELAYEFHFNKDGRVERIAELGRGFGQHTSRGIGLGDTLDKVYSIYGWTDSIKDEDNGKFSLLYNDRYHAQFLILKNKVIGISVFLKENQYMRFEGGSGGGASPGGMGPGMPGMGGMSGSSGMNRGKPTLTPSGGGGRGGRGKMAGATMG